MEQASKMREKAAAVVQGKMDRVMDTEGISDRIREAADEGQTSTEIYMPNYVNDSTDTILSRGDIINYFETYGYTARYSGSEIYVISW